MIISVAAAKIWYLKNVQFFWPTLYICINYIHFSTIHMKRTLKHCNRILPYRHACVLIFLALSYLDEWPRRCLMETEALFLGHIVTAFAETH